MKNEVMELVLGATEEKHARLGAAPGGVVIGVVKELSGSGEPLVDFSENVEGKPVIARTCVAVTSTDIGREVILTFERGDFSKAIIIGLVQPAGKPTPPEVHVDGERLVFSAQKDIVIRCGEASITLTRAGKVLIRGAYLLSRSSGVNRIKGGSVDIN